MWMMPLYLHVNQKSDYDIIIMSMDFYENCEKLLHIVQKLLTVFMKNRDHLIFSYSKFLPCI